MNKPNDKAESGLVLSEQAHQQIKRDIMDGAFVPGEQLRLDAISERYGIGQSPVREALNRLSSEGWVARLSQRGFFVSELSIEDLEELVKTRVWLETKALSESITYATPEWEEGLILAYHRLARTPRVTEFGGIETLNPDWETRHHQFHLQMLSNCKSSWMMHFCSAMMDQSVRYRNLSVNFTRNRRGDALAEHQELLNAALDHDIALACELLTTHYGKTIQGLKDSLN